MVAALLYLEDNTHESVRISELGLNLKHTKCEGTN